MAMVDIHTIVDPGPDVEKLSSSLTILVENFLKKAYIWNFAFAKN